MPSAKVKTSRHNSHSHKAYCLEETVCVHTSTYAHTDAHTHVHTHTEARSPCLHSLNCWEAALGADAALKCGGCVGAEDAPSFSRNSDGAAIKRADCSAR